MQFILHPANERGYANHGWLKANHSFSFAGWYDPDKVNFGALRVLNDDVVAAKMGFSTHPHDNMEIITIPLSGELRHKDSMGNGSVIHAGEVQVMSAGTGVHHSEFNSSQTDELQLFQIWIFPNKKNVEPRYDQIRYDLSATRDRFVQVVSPNPTDDGTWIHQDAWISLAEVDENTDLNYGIKRNGNGAYIMVIEGSARIAGQELNKRDAIGVWNTDTIDIKTNKKTKLIVIDVPLDN
jgi:redox-sensitive bicupin YhaK (pirin superfamily)